MKGAQITTSTLAGIGPASLNILARAALDSRRPLHFQFPPIRYLRADSCPGGPADPMGRVEASSAAVVPGMFLCIIDNEKKKKCQNGSTIAVVFVGSKINVCSSLQNLILKSPISFYLNAPFPKLNHMNALSLYLPVKGL
jgi:hypothetical protein